MESFDREDSYDPTELLSVVQDCGGWPLGHTSLSIDAYEVGVDWYREFSSLLPSALWC